MNREPAERDCLRFDGVEAVDLNSDRFGESSASWSASAVDINSWDAGYPRNEDSWLAARLSSKGVVEL